MNKKIGKWMKRIAVIILIVIAAKYFLAQTYDDKTDINGEADSTKVIEPKGYFSNEDQLINTILTRYHYNKYQLDDSLSSVIFDRYLSSLDHGRIYFLSSDIKDFDQYRYKFDDDIKSGDLDPAYAIFNVFKKRVNNRIEYALELLKKGFDFKKDESFIVERDSLPWPSSQEEYNDLWRKRVKYDALNLLLAGKKWDKIVETLSKRYQNYKKAINQYNSEDVFQLFMNSYTEAIDPHTNYFSPITYDNFKINMSLSLEGIGAQLQLDDDYTKVADIIPGGPAYKSGLLHRGDRIVGVAQGDDGEMVDVIGWRLNDVVQLIRGKKGTTVRLQIIPANETASATKEIKIVRDKVKLEEQAAKDTTLEIIENNKPYKIGVIDIPTFYSDFEAEQRGDKDYKSTARDVRRILNKLKDEHVDGVIVDLRNDGGGSLQEAIKVTGLFIKNGPVVQVRNANGSVDVGRDPANDIVYDGPMAVLVNRFSASASEIFTAAIKDYGRGLILGDNTYGKGTVQNLIDLNRLISSPDGKLGQVKVTISKFYRITGGSTQNKGVKPDITFPSAIDVHEFGESTQPSALPWDQIKPVPFTKFGDVEQYVPKLKELYQKRMDTTSEFDNILEDIQEYKASKDQKVVSLNEAVRKKEKDEQDEQRFQRENERRKKKGLKLLKKGETATADNSKDDPQLNESARILADFINIS